MDTKSSLKFVAKFPHKSLLNLSASKATVVKNGHKILTKICIGNCPRPRVIWKIFRDRGLCPRSRKISQNCPRIRAISGKFRDHPFCGPRKNEVGQLKFSTVSAKIPNLIPRSLILRPSRQNIISDTK